MKQIKKDLYDRDFEKYIENLGFSGKNILDVGCGEGYKTLYFNPEKNAIYGVDIKDRRTMEAKNRINFSLSIGAEMPFQDSFFDVISNFDVIEHVEEDESFVKEMHRMLADKGTLLTFTPNIGRISNKIIELVTGKKLQFPRSLGFDEGLEECIHLREYTKKSLEDLFLHAGFSEVNVQEYWFGFRFPIVEYFRIKTPFPFFLGPYSQYLIAMCRK